MSTQISLHDSLLTYQEAAERLRIHPITLTRYANAGKIDHLKIGKRVFFTEKQLEDFLTNSVVPAKEATS